MKAAYKNITSPKSFAHQKWEKSWPVCQREEGDPNDSYAVTVNTNLTKSVQIKCNNNLSSFQLHFIINLVLTEPKLSHGPVKFPVCLISHFVMLCAKVLEQQVVVSA